MDKSDDFTGQTAAIDKAEEIALKVLSRISFDSNTIGSLIYNSFLKGSVEITPVELSANDFGVEVFFDLKSPQSLSIELQDWDDFTKIF